MAVNWKRIADELPPEGKYVLLYQPKVEQRGLHRDECMGIGKRRMEFNGKYTYWEPEGVDGYEWEWELVAPTHWADRPEAPSAT